MNEPELLFVMGHEMGHFALGHVWQGIALSSAVMILAFYAAYRTAGSVISRFGDRFGFSSLDDIASLPLLLMLVAAFSLITTPAQLAFTRHVEHEADRFGLEITQTSHSAGTAFVKLQTDALAVPRPGLLFTLWRASHPPLGERIDFANDYHPWREGLPLIYSRCLPTDPDTRTPKGDSMCDQNHFDDDLKDYTARGLVTRREFGALMGAGVVMMLPQALHAVAVTESDVNVRTPDGTADCYFVHPATGTAPGVVIWPDIMGLRPAFSTDGHAPGRSRYSVLVVNPFYRQKKAPVIAPGQSVQRSRRAQRAASACACPEPDDTHDRRKSIVAWLDQQAPVAKKQEDRHHGLLHGRSDAPCDGSGLGSRRRGRVIPRRRTGGRGTDSPHLAAAKTKSQFLIAIAENDDMRAPNEKNVLKQTFRQCRRGRGVRGRCHGWCPPDSAVYNEPQAEKAWTDCSCCLERLSRSC
jgi:carboxymethylenebutenolidase